MRPSLWIGHGECVTSLWIGFSGQMQDEVLPFLRTDPPGGGPPPPSLEQNSMELPLDRRILVGNQTYETVYVSRVLFSR